LIGFGSNESGAEFGETVLPGVWVRAICGILIEIPFS
jgi:hypothetical protein